MLSEVNEGHLRANIPQLLQSSNIYNYKSKACLKNRVEVRQILSQ